MLFKSMQAIPRNSTHKNTKILFLYYTFFVLCCINKIKSPEIVVVAMAT